MKSSYNNTVTFGDILSAVTFIHKPKLVVECGILEGYSLSKFVENTNKDTKIEAYDIFEQFNGNHAIKDSLVKQFIVYPNVSIQEGDFYEVYKKYSDKSIDILHIDIANNGDVLEYVFKHYLPKLSKNGIIIFEGGSEERDNIEWMIKYNKSKIKPILDKYSDKYCIKTIGTIPSLTIISNN